MSKHTIGEAESEEIARLYSAAPDLLKACEEIIRAHDAGERIDKIINRVVCPAIGKAKGE